MGIFMKKWKETQKGKYLILSIIGVSVYLIMRYLSAILTPFVVAFLVASLLHPLVEKLHKKTKVKEIIWTGLLLFLIGAFCMLIMTVLLSAMVVIGKKIAEAMPVYQKEFYGLLDNCCVLAEKKLGVDSREVQRFVISQLDKMNENINVYLVSVAMGKSVGYMKKIAEMIGFLLVTAIAILLITKDYKQCRKILEKETLHPFREVGKRILFYSKTFVKAQGIILCLISTISAVYLFVIGIEGGIAYGFLAGILDVLPFIGTGIVLVPLAAFRFLSGSYGQAFLCLLLYGICALLREFLEPKLIGKSMGIWPVGILFGVFAGIQLFGVSGIIKGPLALVIICESGKYLWNSDKNVDKRKT